ncbi:MAG: inositol-3-phosphate synthase [Planctomycetota bacterium]
MTKNGRRSRRSRLGVWLVGARGGLATTLMTGTRAIARGLCAQTGLLTSSGMFAACGLRDLGDVVFGGHDIRQVGTRESALEISRVSATISTELIRKLSADFRKIDAEVRLGCVANSGRAIRSLADAEVREDRRKLRRIVEDLRSDLASFKERLRLERVVVLNLASTEPPLELGPPHRRLAELERCLDRNQARRVRPSLLYAYAAAAESCPFIHFTPSNATLVPAVQELFAETGTPFMGKDGKTGETLVKSALAPMFKYRNLRVLSWQGYNLLGDRDGVVLSNPENRSSKIRTKDSLLSGILGYPLHTHVGIDYVESLGDMKTAWDFIHFEGFLDYRMSMQFIWQGCDAILAAPLLLDMIRLADHAASRGEQGPLVHLASFFKQPIGIAENDLHRQWHLLESYARARSRGQA